MKNIPDRIYLNLGLEEDSTDIDFKELYGVTWSEDKIDADDIEYVRKEPIDWEQRRYEIAKSAMNGILASAAMYGGCHQSSFEVSNMAIYYADALIAELKKGGAE